MTHTFLPVFDWFHSQTRSTNRFYQEKECPGNRGPKLHSHVFARSRTPKRAKFGPWASLVHVRRAVRAGFRGFGHTKQEKKKTRGDLWALVACRGSRDCDCDRDCECDCDCDCVCACDCMTIQDPKWAVRTNDQTRNGQSDKVTRPEMGSQRK